MKKKLAFILVPLGGVALVLGLGAMGTGSQAQAAAGCSASSLRGDFAFSLHGVNPLGQPFGAVGVFTADGSGNLAGNRVSDDNGVRSEADFTCGYTVSSACQLSTAATCMDVGATTSEVTLDGAVSENGRELFLLASGLPAASGGAVATGVAHKR
jgi:hypothetical protein